MRNYKGYMCSLCYSALYPKRLKPLRTQKELATPDFAKRSQVCKCSNLAIIWDEDTTPRLYVHDIRTVRPCLVYVDRKQNEVRRFLRRPFTHAAFTDISTLKSTPWYFPMPGPLKKYKKKTNTTYNTKFRNAMRKHRNLTADGTEKFKRTTKSNPKKR
jgi:hypothetical protein